MNNGQPVKNPLAQNFTIKSLLKFALPTILTMIFMGLYTAVDTAFVARFAGANALSALNIVCPVVNLIVGLATMMATGGSAIIAGKMGFPGLYVDHQRRNIVGPGYCNFGNGFY